MVFYSNDCSLISIYSVHSCAKSQMGLHLSSTTVGCWTHLSRTIGGRTNRLMTWHVWVQIVKDKWDQDRGWVMAPLSQQGIWRVSGAAINGGRNWLSCKGKRGGKYSLWLVPIPTQSISKNDSQILFTALKPCFGCWKLLSKPCWAACMIMQSLQCSHWVTPA